MFRYSKGCLRKSVVGSRLYTQTANGAENFQLTALPNGLRVATSNVPGHFSALGLYVGAGTRNETELLRGCTNILDRLAFKSTGHMSAVEMAEALEQLGGNYQCTSTRESIIYQASVFNQHVEKMFKLMAESVRYPSITSDEIEEQKSAALYDIKGVFENHEVLLPELLHIAAYRGKTLGLPTVSSRKAIQGVSRYLLNDYRNKFYNPRNIVAAFVGVPHVEAVEIVSRYFDDMKDIYPEIKVEPAQYFGAVHNTAATRVNLNLPELYHMHIAFEGLPINHPDIYALATLQTLLGGGGSFSAGGPGKGMYSRLYTDVLNRYHFVDNCVAFNHAYSDSGLFGISMSAHPDAAPYMAPLIAQQFLNLLSHESSHKLSNEEVNRAKNQLKSSLLMNLESKLVELEDLGRQILLHGSKISIKEMVSKIERVTPEDCRRVAEMVLTGRISNSVQGTGAPTIVTQGNQAVFGDVLQVLKREGLGNYDKIESKSTSYDCEMDL
ncbi:mitochondrial-processing protease subunit alpha Ecym_8230 [Eremothecium cymbalariae DBVPG|uniref:Alpha-MPP n=1 Tax=Eremothecium cymbalariae (strain CBS 270.75 / DBVPG 7215 / KCTC 17166 / NRRL Y-17582) TaxID=931890 RepID=G8JXE1_ERECY|nr:Hypothetical protein Ecym_8230 [Eremothecium cymbalariae DBVPG\